MILLDSSSHNLSHMNKKKINRNKNESILESKPLAHQFNSIQMDLRAQRREP